MRIAPFVASVAIAAAPVGALAQVGSDRIVHAEKEPSEWLTYSGNYQAHRFSPLTQITRQNVAQLRPAWIYQVRRTGIVETSPITALSLGIVLPCTGGPACANASLVGPATA